MDKCMRQISDNFVILWNTQKNTVSTWPLFNHITTEPLRTISAVRAVLFGAGGIGGARNKPLYVCDTSTVTNDYDTWLPVQDLHSLYAIPTSGFNKICRQTKTAETGSKTGKQIL